MNYPIMVNIDDTGRSVVMVGDTIVATVDDTYWTQYYPDGSEPFIVDYRHVHSRTGALQVAQGLAELDWVHLWHLNKMIKQAEWGSL